LKNCGKGFQFKISKFFKLLDRILFEYRNQNNKLSQKFWYCCSLSATSSVSDFALQLKLFYSSLQYDIISADASGDLVSHMITCAMAWCDGYTAPLLVPLNGWLQPPLPLQIKSKSIY
jgi:hypothetical protein